VRLVAQSRVTTRVEDGAELLEKLAALGEGCGDTVVAAALAKGWK